MPSRDITVLLRELEAGSGDGATRLAEAVHGTLQRIAEREFAARYGHRAGAITIEPGVLADDALMKILDGTGAEFEDRRRLFAYATKIIVNALIDYQRRRLAQRRGGHLIRVTLGGARDVEAVDVEKLPALLDQLRELDARKAEIVNLRVFWGMSVKEAAAFLDISPSTVDRDWRFAHRWLAMRLAG